MNGAKTSSKNKPKGLNSNNFNNEQIVKLIIQTLESLNYNETATSLVNESGIKMEADNVVDFKKSILQGEYEQSEEILLKLDLEGREEILFLIREQSFLEYLEGKKYTEAIKLLQTKIATLKINTERVKFLSKLSMCSSNKQLMKIADWSGKHGESRTQLLLNIQKHIPPGTMIPNNRMFELLNQSINYQYEQCKYPHETISYDLFSDHKCLKSKSLKITQLLSIDEHEDEVWYVKFSNDGRYLATASKDHTCIIYDLITNEIAHVLTAHSEAVSFLDWSPDDSCLITCGNDNVLRIWDTTTGICLRSLTKHTEPVTACGWHPDGFYFVSSGLDKNIYLWSTNGQTVHRWYGSRVTDITINGRMMATVCQDKKVKIYDLDTKNEIKEIVEDSLITSASFSKDGKFLLCNLASQEIHLWKIETNEMINKYTGHLQGKFVIRSCFAGKDDEYVISGSEDSCVYVWLKESGVLIEKIEGHKNTANTVSWNETKNLIASASDDNTVKIWQVE